MRLISFVLYPVLLVAWATSASADMISADGITASLELPKTYCRLTKEHPTEKDHIELQERMQTSNGVMIFAVPCANIDSVRKGDLLSEYAIWLLNGPPGNHIRLPSEMTREAVVSELITVMPAVDLKEIESDVSGNVAKEGFGLKLRDLRMIANDKTAFYSAQTVNVDKGEVKREMAVVTGWAAMSERIFTVNLYRDLNGPETITSMLEMARDTIQRSMAATDAQAKAAPPP
jgi:hypothetical protein